MALPHRIFVPLIVACALLMENLDSTIIATALPQIAQSLDEPPLHLSLAITAYLLSLAVFIPLSGWVADRFGAKNVFRVAILIFMAGSIFCGVAQSMPQLVAARIMQGIGGSMMTPVGRLVLLRSVEKHEMVSAMTWLTMPALLGPVMGPPLGGLIATYADWRWIFFINIPIGLIGLVLVTRFIEDVREPERRILDLRGWIVAGAGLAALMFGFENVGRDVLPGGLVAALFVAAAGLLGYYTLHAHRHPMPIIDLALFSIPTFRVAVVGGSVFRVGTGALPFLLPLMLQLGFGMTPFESGSLTFASAAGALLMKTTAPRIIRRLGFRPVLIGNTVLSAMLLGACALFRPETPHMLIVACLLTGGFFRSLQFTCTGTLTYADVPAARMSRATSLAATMQQFATTVGVATGALLLHAITAYHGRTDLTSADFPPAFAGVALISVTSLVWFLALTGDAGGDLRGRAAKAG